MVVQGQFVTQQCGSNNFIKCIVAANILTYYDQLTIAVKKGGGMKTSRDVEYFLMPLKLLLQYVEKG